MLSITKLQNLKAIHNSYCAHNVLHCVVINHKVTKFESNSQLNARYTYRLRGCYQSQNYKISKQFTTGCACTPLPVRLLSITKLQKLKAIHNGFSYAHHRVCVVINHKTTKFESNSQLPPKAVPNCLSLLSITKLQNLKAIHNRSITINNY